MKTFICVTEIWLPSEDGTLLEFGGGLYGSASNFGAISASMCFGRGEGLPGRAWDEGCPVLLKTFDGSYFRRTAAARAAGLSCGIAIPLFQDETLKAVVVFFCGDAQSHAGAIELWHNDPRITTDLTMVDGYFGADTANLEALSRDAYLPRGAGLPGMAWQRGGAVFIADLDQSTRFLRTVTAAEAGINRGLAIPCATRQTGAYVMAFLSASRTPIAQRIESWVPDASLQHLRRAFGFCERSGHLDPAQGGLSLSDSSSAIVRAFTSGVPALSEPVSAEPGGIGDSAGAADLRSLLAFPLACDGTVTEVVALYF